MKMSKEDLIIALREFLGIEDELPDSHILFEFQLLAGKARSWEMIKEFMELQNKK